MGEPLESIIKVLDEQCEEEIIELDKKREIVAKVIEKRAVAEVLRFGRMKGSAMQQVLEYDFNKLILFCLLFCEENPKDKVTCLFYLMCDQNDIINHKNG